MFNTSLNRAKFFSCRNTQCDPYLISLHKQSFTVRWEKQHTSQDAKIWFSNTLSSFSNTGVNEAWPAKSRNLATQRLPTAKTIYLYDSIHCGLKIKQHVFRKQKQEQNKCLHIYIKMIKVKSREHSEVCLAVP